MTKNLESDNTLSFARAIALRSEAFAHVRHHTAMILSLATGIETLDAALMSSTERNVDESQALIDAARRLSALIGGER